jgi:hypothetical protein
MPARLLSRYKRRALGLGAVAVLGLGGALAVAAPAFAVQNGNATVTEPRPVIAPGGTGSIGDGILGNSSAVAASPVITFQAPPFATFTVPDITVDTVSGAGVITNGVAYGACSLSNGNMTLTCNSTGANGFSWPAFSDGDFAQLDFIALIAVSPNAAPGTTYSGTFTNTASGAIPAGTIPLAYTTPAAVKPTITGPASGSGSTATPTITGTGQPGDPVTITDQNGNTVCTTTVSAAGTFSCTVTNPLGDGPDTLTATETNSDGTTTVGPADAITAVGGSTPPTVTGPASGSTVTPTPTITGTGTADDPVTVTDQNGNTVCTTTVAADGTFSCTPSTPLADGSDTLTATVTNPDGSTTAGPADAFTVVPAAGSPMANPEVAGGLGAGLVALGGIELVRRRRRAARRVAA